MDAHRAAAQRVAALLKARLARDRQEPGRARKEKREAALEKAALAYFARLSQKVERKLQGVVKAQPRLFDDDDLYDDEFEKELLLVLVDAARDGARLAGERAKIDIDYTLTNKEAAKWVRQYVTKFLKDLSQTTKDQINAAVEAFVNTPGMTLGDTIAMIGLEDVDRAQRIAVTEITRAYAEGNLEYGRELKEQFPDVRVTKRWYTNEDDRVCPVCDLDETDREVEMDEDFSNGFDGPPAHPSCRCWLDVGTRL